MAINDHIANLLERISRLLINDHHTHGLKPVQWEALRYLARANRFSCTPGAVGQFLGLTKGTVSQTLSALERKQLIRKTADQRDKRSVNLELTAAGRALIQDDPLHALTVAIDALSPARKTQLASALESLLQRQLDERSGRAFGQCRNCRFCERDSEGATGFRCGLLDTPLSFEDTERICVEFEAG